MGGGAREADIFSTSGLNHLRRIDWLDFYVRTAMIASLVQGVYSLQRDKQQKRKFIANPYWESFGFSLAETLINKDDGSIFGAVYEYNDYHNKPHCGMPRCVIAFRGTMLELVTCLSDMKENIRCILDNFNNGSRIKQAIKAIDAVLEKHSTDKTSVWLAGHSLGAATALLAGKTIAKRGDILKTYAFNPPSSSVLLENIFDSVVVKGMLRLAETLIKVTIVKFSDIEIQEDDPSTTAWTPYIYVNPSDPFCAEYIGILSHKCFMAAIKLGKLESIAAKFSFMSRILFGEEGGEPIQLFSSVEMTINMNKSDLETDDHGDKQSWSKFKKAHGIEQWWEPNPALRKWKSHSFRPSY
ncbi:unnamed protein product [Eruca vesicaria subsp. sativa]|uniref:Fungal lipase-type domain-containing protein n=1 Tax=Eruca vesicaria subsp. sativa TaxID=29727 RepID=A0ABC8JSK5_ERUVS|nr:unnamed protein product [Eruca vesicaria subsp. sativa]